MSAVIRRPITTTEDQSTTFIELFFDLVFVYAVTQTVSLVHEELSWAGVAHAVIVFWLVWWAGRCSWWPSDSSCWARRSERQGKRRGELERGTVASEVALTEWLTQL